jgi:hypothetical protein
MSYEGGVGGLREEIHQARTATELDDNTFTKHAWLDVAGPVAGARRLGQQLTSRGQFMSWPGNQSSTFWC